MFNEEPGREAACRPGRAARAAGAGVCGTAWSTSSTSQILDVLVPQMEDQLVEFMRGLDTATPEQVIAVPEISQDRIPQRFVDTGRPQRAEQLVEVPTVVSHSSLQRHSAEQNVDIPVPGTRGDRGGLQGFHPRQGSQHTVEQIVDSPVLGGGPQDFLPVLGWQLHPQHRVMSWVKGFSHFSCSKKGAHSGRQVSAELGGHVSSSTLSSSRPAVQRPSMGVAYEVGYV